MKLLILFGPPAVGKLTVGKQIEAHSDFKLFHNHAVMDGIMHIFGRGTPAEDRLSRLVRESVIGEAANSGIDLIFTYTWNFSRPEKKDNIDAYKAAYELRGGQVFFIELDAPLEVRAERADDPERHQHKPQAPKATDVSPQPFFYPDIYTRINTAGKTPAVIAKEILGWLDSRQS
jgi:hypothetical protein